MPQQIPYYTTILEDYVTNLYHNMGIFVPEQIDMLKVAEKLKIWLHFAPFGSRAIERDGLSSIVIDERKTAPEQWEDFGHELGHILFQAGNQLYMPKMFLEYQEAKAHNFALHFCAPTFMLQKLAPTETKIEMLYLIASTFNITLRLAEQRLEHYENQLLAYRIQKALQSYLFMQEKSLGGLSNERILQKARR